MNAYARYALFVVPSSAFYAAGAAWLGWDSVSGETVAHPSVPGVPVSVDALTEKPRKYGLHGTIKAPFALAPGQTEAALRAACRSFCADQPPVRLPGLKITRLNRFVAAVPTAPSSELGTLAAAAVEALDPFRAPLTEAEIARRRASRLTAAQDALLLRWGYPYVMDAFRFHLTLTGPHPQAEALQNALTAHLAPTLPSPFDITDLALMGEDGAGRFHLLNRFTLAAHPR
ncbi:DUF1045 domain-containing protein [Gymnodinialimonas sp. 2307UL20-7]